MLQEEKAKIELPAVWKRINFYSLNLAYCLAVLFASLQVSAVHKILIKALLTQREYDVVNGFVLSGLLITAAGSGALGYVRMITVKKIISTLENDDKKPD